MNLFQKIFQSPTRKKEPLTTERIEEIISGYGLFLEKNSLAPGCVADKNELPYPKNEIKKALLFAISITEEPTMKEHLKTGYIELASWQDNVGESSKGIDCINIDLNANTSELANTILQQSSDFEKWKLIVENEQKSLINDLKNFA